MNSRQGFIGAAVALGVIGGPAVLRAVSPGPAAIAWPVLAAAFSGGAIGLPLLLVFLASGGRYRAMVRAWSAFGLLAVLLLAAGGSAAAVSGVTSRLEPNAVLSLVAGAGLMAGLGLVKLALGKGRA